MLARAAVDERVTAVLLSADQKLWGDCRVDYTGRQEDGAGITVYEMDPPPDPNGGVMGGFGYEGGWGCPSDNELVPADCDTISFSLMERRSEEVARVDVELINGAKLSTVAERGFYAFEYEGPAGGLRPVNRDGVTKPMEDLVQRLQFFDADGTLIAEETADGVTPTRGVPRISGLPQLTGTPYGFEEPIEEHATEEPAESAHRAAAARPHREGEIPGRLHVEGPPGRRRDAGGPARGGLARDRPHRGRGAAGFGRQGLGQLRAAHGRRALRPPRRRRLPDEARHLCPGRLPRGLLTDPERDPAGTRGFVWQLVEKLDPEVARVEATLADGQEIGNDTTDGYIALGGAGRLPADAAWDKDYFTPVPLVSSLRFYDADGKLLGESTDGNAVDGYPSQRWVPGP